MSDEKVVIDKKIIKYKVNKDVVKALSVGLYTNFARAIKELISNSYDSLATQVWVRLDLEEKTITLRDDGKGMSYDDIENRLFNLAYQKELSNEGNKVDERPRVGRFGIGFVSIFRYCERILLVTKQRNSDDMFEIEIDTTKFFSKGKLELTDIPIVVRILESDLPKDQGETIIKMTGIGEQYLSDFRKEEDGRSSINKMKGYDKFKWTLAQYAPIQFPPEREDLRSFFDKEYGQPMKLWLDGEELFRNVPNDAVILEKGNETIGGIKFRYAIMTNYGSIEPQEGRGLQIRFRNVGISFPTDFDVVKLTGANLGKINYLCGEIHILSDISDYLLINRDEFSYTPEISEFYEFFRKRLNKKSWELEKLVKDEKPIYESIAKMKNRDEILTELKKASIIHFKGNSVRVNNNTPFKISKTPPLSPFERTKSLLNEKGYKVIVKEESKNANQPPIRVYPENKTIVIYEKNDGMAESIEALGISFKVKYEKWDVIGSDYFICKREGDEVRFNLNSKLFLVSNLTERLKKFSLTASILADKDSPGGSKKIQRIIEQAIEETFLKE